MQTGVRILTKLIEKKEATKPNLADDPGIKAPYWFWGSDTYKLLGDKKATPVVESPVEVKNETPAVDDQVNQLLAENPQISGATFLNLLKSKGFKIVIPEDLIKKEADDGGAFPQVMRQQESVDLKHIGFKARLIESSAKDNGIGFTRFKVVLLQEGMGNMKDAFYYSKDALVSAIPIFEGKKIFADHPSEIEEQTRPERSVKDVLGHFEKVHIEEGETGESMLMADVVILPDKPYEWARALMRHAVEYAKTYPDKSFIGLSINASGDADVMPIDSLVGRGVPESALVKLQKAKENGIDSVRVVSKIVAAVSCDLVTEAGAGGKVLEMLEHERVDLMNKKNKTIAQEAINEAASIVETEETQVKESKSEEIPEDKEKKEETKESQEQAPPAPEHKDEEQDVALIKKLLKDYIGGEGEPTEEECNMAKEAMSAAKEMGMEGEEAAKCAGYSMKMAKHMAMKQSKKTETEETQTEEACKPKESDKVTESTSSDETIKLAGENAKLKEQIFNLEKEKEIEKMLQESGLPRAATKAIRKKLEESKSMNEIKMKFELFKEGYSVVGGEAKHAEGLFVQPEKQTTGSHSGLNLSDCLVK